MKKKIIIGLAAIALMSAMALPVSAQDTTKDTAITAKVPSEYTLTIPAKTDITFNALSTDLAGKLKVTGNVLPSQDVVVTANKQNFHNEAQKTDLSYKLMNKADNTEFTTATWDEAELRGGLTGTGKEIQLAVSIAKTDWQNAKAGSYEGSITFTAVLQDID